MPAVNKKKAVCICLLFFLGALWAEENTPSTNDTSLRDDELMGLLGEDSPADVPLVVDSASIENQTLADAVNKKSVTFNGSLDSRSSYSMSRDYFFGKSNAYNKNAISSYVQGDFSADARLGKGFKGYVSGRVYYSPFASIQQNITYNPGGFNPGLSTNYSLENTFFSLQEFFIDLNVQRYVYMRLGKQVLQWGRGYLWNPTDLVNTEKKNFFDLNASRSGAYGAKLHIPFGSKVNWFTFGDLSGATNFDRVAGASKFEALLNNTEVSVSGWWKKNKHSVFGADLSTRIPGADINFTAEASLSYGNNKQKVKRKVYATNIAGTDYILTNYVPYKENKDWTPAVCAGLGRSFTVGGKEDRLAVHAELFYNGAGYTNNIFRQVASDYTNSAVTAQLLSGYYIPLYHSRYYAALFFSFSDFIVSDLTMSMNFVGNIDDQTVTTVLGLGYSPVYNLLIGLNISGYYGRGNGEFTFNGQALKPELYVQLTF